MVKKEITYTFVQVEECNMCKGTNFRILGKRLNQHQGKNPQQKTGITTSIVKCIGCGLIFANPLPIPRQIADHYEVEVDSYFSIGADKIPDDYFHQQLDFFKTCYPATPEVRALDIGSGLGSVMNALKKNGVDAYGLEPSKSFYDYSLAQGISRDRIFNSSMEEAAFGENFFDLIIFSAVFEHLYDPNKALVKALTWLKPHGIIHISVPSNRIFIQLLANFFYRIKGLDYVSNISPMHAPFHLYEFGVDTFEKNSKLNGYTIIRKDLWTTENYLFRKHNPIIKKIISLTKSEMNLSVWLRKN